MTRRTPVRRPGTWRRLATATKATAAVLAVGVLAACSTGTYAATPLPTPSSAPTPSSSAAPAPTCSNPLRSYSPPPSLPAPGAMPAGSTMRRIQDRGRLIAGVSADTLLLGARNPISGAIQGFDIDMLHLVAKALLGNPDKLELRVITAAQRIPSLTDGTVDIVARNMTINCLRWTQIAFSAEYFRAGQKVLVPLGSRANALGDLKGKRVCAPARTTSLDNIGKVPGVVAVSSDTHTGCLVLFQQAKVDAITGDDTVLAGLAAQDPYAKVVGRAFTAEPYGLGMSAKNVDLVRFVNGVLARAKTDGTWKKSYNRWFAADLGPAPAPPVAQYGR